MKKLLVCLAASSLLLACPGNPKSGPDGGAPDAGPGDAGSGDAGSGDGGLHDGGPNDGGSLDAATGLESVPLQTTLMAPGLSAPVDVVRDTYGNPHIYGNSLPDISYAQGYTVAHDRLIELDFERHDADGTLSYLIGNPEPSILA